MLGNPDKGDTSLWLLVWIFAFVRDLEINSGFCLEYLLLPIPENEHINCTAVYMDITASAFFKNIINLSGTENLFLSSLFNKEGPDQTLCGT